MQILATRRHSHTYDISTSMQRQHSWITFSFPGPALHADNWFLCSFCIAKHSHALKSKASITTTTFGNRSSKLSPFHPNIPLEIISEIPKPSPPSRIHMQYCTVPSTCWSHAPFQTPTSATVEYDLTFTIGPCLLCTLRACYSEQPLYSHCKSVV